MSLGIPEQSSTAGGPSQLLLLLAQHQSDEVRVGGVIHGSGSPWVAAIAAGVVVCVMQNVAPVIDRRSRARRGNGVAGDPSGCC
jgi:hypothetical protein